MNGVRELLLDALKGRSPPALFVTELAAKVRSPELEPALQDLAAQRTVVVSAYGAPDPHLEGLDLRVVALVPPDGEAAALQASAEVWGAWLRQFLANHRCQ